MSGTNLHNNGAFREPMLTEFASFAVLKTLIIIVTHDGNAKKMHFRLDDFHCADLEMTRFSGD